MIITGIMVLQDELKLLKNAKCLMRNILLKIIDTLKIKKFF